MSYWVNYPVNSNKGGEAPLITPNYKGECPFIIPKRQKEEYKRLKEEGQLRKEKHLPQSHSNICKSLNIRVSALPIVSIFRISSPLKGED